MKITQSNDLDKPLEIDKVLSYFLILLWTFLSFTSVFATAGPDIQSYNLVRQASRPHFNIHCLFVAHRLFRIPFCSDKSDSAKLNSSSLYFSCCLIFCSLEQDKVNSLACGMIWWSHPANIGIVDISTWYLVCQLLRHCVFRTVSDSSLLAWPDHVIVCGLPATPLWLSVVALSPGSFPFTGADDQFFPPHSLSSCSSPWSFHCKTVFSQILSILKDRTMCTFKKVIPFEWAY